jgi:O-antigen/teichoic acid export membrane protein
MDLKSNVLSGLITGIGGFSVQIVASLLLVPLVIHFLGADDYGFYVFLFGLVDIFMAFDMGINQGLLQRLSHFIAVQDEGNRMKLLAIAHWLYGMLSMLLLAAGILSIGWLGSSFSLAEHQRTISPLLFSLVVLDAAINLYGCYYQAILKAHCLHKWINMSGTLNAILFNLTVIGLLLLGYNLVAIFMARIIITIFTNLVYAYRAWQAERTCHLIKVSLSFQDFRGIFGISFYTLLQRLSGILANQMDGMLIARFLLMADVGVYGFVNRIFSYLLMICWKAIDTFFPVFTRLSSSNNLAQARKVYLRLSTFVCFLVSLMLLEVMSVFPEFIHYMGSGQLPLSKALPLALVMLPNIWSSANASISVNYLLAAGTPRRITIMNLLIALVNFPLSLFLVQTLGFIGPALVTTALNLIYHQLFAHRLACRSLGLPRMEYIRHVYLANLPPLLAASLCLYLGRCGYQVLGKQLALLPIFGTIAGLISCVWWLKLTSTSEERKLLTQKLQLASNAFVMHFRLLCRPAKSALEES